MKPGQSLKRGLVLEVPFPEKDEAKKLGARWDPEIKKWFVPAGVASEPFRRWFPSSEERAAE